MTDTNYLYEYFLTHSQETAEEPVADSTEAEEDETES
jgi:hypothetical protein